MLWEAAYIIGFALAIVALLAHIVGFTLIFHSKTKLVNQRMILMNFSVCTVLGTILYTLRGMYSYIHKRNLQKIAKFYLKTNGFYIGISFYYILLMFILTLDRLIITIKPYRHDKVFPKQYCIIALIVFGVIGAVSSTIFLIHQKRSADIVGYRVSMAFTCFLSLFNFICYAFIFHIIYKNEDKVFSRRRSFRQQRNKRKIVVPLLINITLLVFFVAPHSAIIIEIKNLTYFEISCITMGTANAGFILDASVFNLGFNTRKALVKFMKKFILNRRSSHHSTSSMPVKESKRFGRNYSGNVAISTLWSNSYCLNILA